MAIQRWRDSLLGARRMFDVDAGFERLEAQVDQMMLKTEVLAGMGSKEVASPIPSYAAQGLSSAGNSGPAAAQIEFTRRLAYEFGATAGFALPFEHIHIVLSKPTGKVAVFFLGPDGKPGYFEEEAIGFPSKELLSKLQLVRTS